MKIYIVFSSYDLETAFLDPNKCAEYLLTKEIYEPYVWVCEEGGEIYDKGYTAQEFVTRIVKTLCTSEKPNSNTGN